MQSDNNIKEAITILKEMPENSVILKVLGLLQEELEGPTQEEVLDAAKGQVEEIMPAREGSYVLQKVKCGDPTCHCSKKPEDYHGPYWYLFTKKNGKTRSRYIGKTRPA